MLRLRPLLRQIRRPSNQILHQHVRPRHGASGPHKEYFQTPAQAQNLVKDFGYRPEHIQQVLHVDQFQQPSFFRRFLRGTALVSTFLLLGWCAGQALISWEYYQPQYEAGSEEDLDFAEEIDETLLTSPIVETLLADGWIPSDEMRYEVEQGGRHLVHDSLQGSKGVTMRFFRHPVEKAAHIVCFMGFGVEDGPDVVSGGLVATLLQEAVYMAAKDNFKDLVTIPDLSMFNITYYAPVRPGQIYSITVVQAGFALLANDEDHPKIRNQYFAILVDGDPPKISRVQNPEKPDQTELNILTQNGRHNNMLAVADMRLWQIPKQFVTDQQAEQAERTPEEIQDMRDEIERIADKDLKEARERDKKTLQNLPKDAKP